MDNLVYEETINTEISSSEFVDKQWLYVNDNNNSSYSGQIVIDTTSLSNCGQYLNWMESFLTIPLVLQLQSSAGGSLPTATPADFMVGLKSGYWNIIHSLIVEYNNSNVVQQVPYLNVFNSFKANTSWSDGDVENWGSLTGYYPDSADSWVYNTFGYNPAGSANILNAFGSGICNNSNSPYVQLTNYAGVWIPALAGTPGAPATFPTIEEGTDIMNVVSYNEETQATSFSSAVRSSTYNKGFYRRQQWLNFSPQNNPGGLGQFGSNQSALITTAQMSAIFRSYTQAIPQQRAYVFDAVIRMKDICDMFSKMPMVKGGTMRLYINTNQCYFTAQYCSGTYLDSVAAQGNVQVYGEQAEYNQLCLTSSPIILGGGGTNPIMLASSDIGQGGFQAVGLLPASAGANSTLNVAVGLSIVRTQFPQLINAISPAIACPITSTRLYCPAYTMSPLAEQRLLSLCPTKKVVYNDIFYYTFPDVAAGQTFSFLVSNGIPNLRGCLVVPTLRQNANGTAANGSVVCDSILSPFSTSPATPDPIALTNFNIQVSGKNLFITNLLYDYEVFAEQLVSSNQLNGSLTTSLASGQISFSDFERLYRYYYGNISRSIPSEDGVAKAIQVVGQNASTQTISFQVFLEFERTITIDLRTGARIE
jgi:hypothetical protein